jgi:hypothetical protein
VVRARAALAFFGAQCGLLMRHHECADLFGERLDGLLVPAAAAVCVRADGCADGWGWMGGGCMGGVGWVCVFQCVRGNDTCI